MKIKRLTSVLFIAAVMTFTACGNETQKENENAAGDSTKTEAHTASLKEESVNYTVDGKTMTGYLAYDENKKGGRPAVLIVHEWWGLNDYIKSRARQLAQLGYLAFAVDMYGNGKVANNPQEAQQMATPFYTNPLLTKTYLDAAINKLKEYPQADTSKVAAIGYCYGGFVVLNAAKLGSDFKGVVSFHGNLAGVPPKRDLLKAKILVCHGQADKFVSEQEVNAFKHAMDSVGADYTFKSYPGATHAFTNPQATETGKKFNMPIEYNPAADTASWNDMKSFFGKIF